MSSSSMEPKNLSTVNTAFNLNESIAFENSLIAASFELSNIFPEFWTIVAQNDCSSIFCQSPTPINKSEKLHCLYGIIQYFNDMYNNYLNSLVPHSHQYQYGRLCRYLDQCKFGPAKCWYIHCNCIEALDKAYHLVDWKENAQDQKFSEEQKNVLPAHVLQRQKIISEELQQTNPEFLIDMLFQRLQICERLQLPDLYRWQYLLEQDIIFINQKQEELEHHLNGSAAITTSSGPLDKKEQGDETVIDIA